MVTSRRAEGCDLGTLDLARLLLIARSALHHVPSLVPQHYGPVDKALAEFAAETGILAAAVDFPKKCGDLLLASAAKAGAPTGRALDLGCAVGRSTFEIAREFSEVVGIDISQTFIDGAPRGRARRAARRRCSSPLGAARSARPCMHELLGV